VELEPLLEWFGHGVVVGVVVEGVVVVVVELAGVVVVVVEAAPDITVPRPRPRPRPRVLPATPTPKSNFLRDDAMVCSLMSSETLAGGLPDTHT
jgi:hypothetical protein